MIKISILHMSLNATNLRLQPHLPGARVNELIQITANIHIMASFLCLILFMWEKSQPIRKSLDYVYGIREYQGHVLSITRRSENDNTPQPIDQRMESLLMGQQGGNCNSFAPTHYLVNTHVYLVCAVAHGQDHLASPRLHSESNIVSYLHPLLFQVNWSSHSWGITIWKFNLENPSPRAWVRVKVMVI